MRRFLLFDPLEASADLVEEVVDASGAGLDGWQSLGGVQVIRVHDFSGLDGWQSLGRVEVVHDFKISIGGIEIKKMRIILWQHHQWCVVFVQYATAIVFSFGILEAYCVVTVRSYDIV